MRRVLLQAVVLLATEAVAAAPVYLTIGDGVAGVRETRTLTFAPGARSFVLEPIPAGADLSSLMLRTKRLNLELRSWSLRRSAPAVVRPGDDRRGWSPPGPEPLFPNQQAGLLAVEGELSTPPARSPVEVEVFYRLPGLSWAASYQAVVRGDRVEEREPLSVDFTGWIRLENRTGRTFSNVVVRLVGRRRPLPGEQEKPLGFLIMDESNPMTDLWQWRPPEKEMEYEYEMPEPVVLPANASREYLFIKSARVPATRRYVLRAEDLAAVGREPGAPLRKFIVVANTAANRLGKSLPPGPVCLFSGSARSQLLPGGHLPHTPAGGYIRVDLGLSEEVTGWRTVLQRQPLPEGGAMETFALDVVNHREGGITVELDEKPPVIFEWSVIRSTKPYREVFRRLLYEFDVPAGERDRVEYSLRIRQPGL